MLRRLLWPHLCLGKTLLSTIWNGSIWSHLVHPQSTHDSHGLHPLQRLSCICCIKLCTLYYSFLPWLCHHLLLEPVVCSRDRVALALHHPQLPLTKHCRARRQLLLLPHLPCATREAHLSAVHPGRRSGVLRKLAGSGEAGGRARAVDLAEASGAGHRLRGRRRLQLLLRTRREVRGCSGCGWVELRGGDGREVGDGGGGGDLGG